MKRTIYINSYGTELQINSNNGDMFITEFNKKPVQYRFTDLQELRDIIEDLEKLEHTLKSIKERL